MKPPRPIEWEAYEYEYSDKHGDWFWAVGVLTVAIAATAIILGNVLFAIVILLGGFTLTVYAAREPRRMTVSIDSTGVRMDKHYYPYRTLESFWVDEEGSPKILLKSQKLIMPYIIVPIEDVSPEKVRRYLERYLPETFHSETVFQKFMEYLGF